MMELDPVRHKILAAVDGAAETILSVSHQIHERPELGYEERFAADLLMSTLEAHGFTVERGFAGIETAFCARKGKADGPRVAFLAEYDALPVIGHGCGHNVIGSSALAAGIGLGAVVEDLPGGQVWVIGTPAEETDGGKIVMVERGAFNEIDAALMIHPHDGSYTLTEALAMDALQVEYHGKTSHAAAAPWEGKNALDAVILLFNGVSLMRQQVKPDARIHGIIRNGGLAPNVIPDYACARFYLRARTSDYVKELVARFKAIAEAAAQATGTTVEFSNYENSFDDMANNHALANRMTDYMTMTLGAGPFKRQPDHFGSVDMGNVSHVVPGIHVLVDIGNGARIYPHTSEFCAAAATPYADAALLRAGKGLALTGYDALADGEFLAAAKAEFEEKLGYAPARG